MGVYRQIQTSIWQDPFFFSLTPRDKLFFLYLISNSHTTQCGIFEHSTAMIAMDLAYSERIVKEQVQWFIDQGKLKYDPLTHEFLVVSWLTYHDSNSPSVQTRVQSELTQVKSAALMSFWTQCAHSVDTLSPKEKEKENEKEKEERKEKGVGKESKKRKRVRKTINKGHSLGLEAPPQLSSTPLSSIDSSLGKEPSNQPQGPGARARPGETPSSVSPPVPNSQVAYIPVRDDPPRLTAIHRGCQEDTWRHSPSG